MYHYFYFCEIYIRSKNQSVWYYGIIQSIAHSCPVYRYTLRVASSVRYNMILIRIDNTPCSNINYVTMSLS